MGDTFYIILFFLESIFLVSTILGANVIVEFVSLIFIYCFIFVLIKNLI